MNYFVKDIEGKQNVDKLKQKHKNPNDRYEIDKDLLKSGNKVYCNEYVTIVPHTVNVQERNERYDYNKEFVQTSVFKISKDFKEFTKYDSIEEALKSVGGRYSSNISSVCRGDFITYKDFYWHYNDGSTKEEMKNNIEKRIGSTQNFRTNRNRKNYVLISDEGEIYNIFMNHTLSEIAEKLGVSISSVGSYKVTRKYKSKYRLKLLEELNNE